MAESTTRDFTELAGGQRVAMDAKGRIMLPAPVREELGKTFVLARGMHQNLVCYPDRVYNDLKAQISKYPVWDPMRAEYERLMLGGAVRVTHDGTDRFLVPVDLRTPAKLSGRVQLVGMSDWLELWNPEVYAEYEQRPVGEPSPRLEMIQQAYDRLSGRA